MGNKGIVMKEMLLLFCILLFCLLMIGFYSENFPSSKDDSSSSNDSSSAIDYDYYHNYEKKMVNAAKQYIQSNNYKFNDTIFSVELETLVNTTSLDSLYDKMSNKKCTGYVVVSSDSEYKSYLQCDEYKTVG